MKLTETRAKEAVKAGVGFLNRTQGARWPSRIDTNVLDMGSCINCVIGQLYGYYGQGMRELGLYEVGFSSRYGFNWHAGYGNTNDRALRLLTRLWKKKIQQLQGAA